MTAPEIVYYHSMLNDRALLRHALQRRVYIEKSTGKRFVNYNGARYYITDSNEFGSDGIKKWPAHLYSKTAAD